MARRNIYTYIKELEEALQRNNVVLEAAKQIAEKKRFRSTLCALIDFIRFCVENERCSSELVEVVRKYLVAYVMS